MSDFNDTAKPLCNAQTQDEQETGQKTQLEDKRSGDSKMIIEAKNRKEQELLKAESANFHFQNETKITLHIPKGAYAIDEHEQNNPHNPSKESTNIIPINIRRVESTEILPAPFRTTTQLLVCTYLTCLCCCFCGAFAAKAAFQAKILRNKGLYVPAKRQARKALYCMLGAVISGLVIATIIGIILGLHIQDKSKNN